jgi:hypothetical protein
VSGGFDDASFGVACFVIAKASRYAGCFERDGVRNYEQFVRREKEHPEGGIFTWMP